METPDKELVTGLGEVLGFIEVSREQQLARQRESHESPERRSSTRGTGRVAIVIRERLEKIATEQGVTIQQTLSSEQSDKTST